MDNNIANNTLQFGDQAFTVDQLKETYNLEDVKFLKNRQNGNISVGMLPKGKSWNDSDAVLFGAVSHNIDWSKPIIFKECWHEDENPVVDDPFIMAMNDTEHHFFDFFEEVVPQKENVTKKENVAKKVNNDVEKNLPF